MLSVISDQSGFSVSLSSDGSIVAIGAPNGNYVKNYHYNGSLWELVGNKITGGAGDKFGCYVSLCYC